MNVEKKRIDWIDLAKGYGTVLVIMGHLSGDVKPLQNFIYCFHIPLFFFLSGYVFSYRGKFPEFFLKKVKALVIPYFILAIPVFLALVTTNTIYNGFSTSYAFWTFVGFFIQRRQGAIWFMTCLFFLNLLFYSLVRLCRDRLVFIGFFSVLLGILGLIYYQLGGPALPWNVDVCLTASPFFGGGYVIKSLLKDKKFSVSPVFTIPIGIALFFAVLFLGRYSYDHYGTVLEMYMCRYANPLITYAAAFSGIGLTVIAARLVTVRPVRFVGRNSLIYYAWHQDIMIPIVWAIERALHLPDRDSWNLLFKGAFHLGETVFILAVLSVAVLLVSRTPLKKYLTNM